MGARERFCHAGVRETCTEAVICLRRRLSLMDELHFERVEEAFHRRVVVVATGPADRRTGADRGELIDVGASDVSSDVRARPRPRWVASLIADGMVEYTPRERIRVSAEGFPVLDAVIRSRSVEGIRFDPLIPRDREALWAAPANLTHQPPHLGTDLRAANPPKHSLACGRWVAPASRKFDGVIDLRAEGTGVSLTIKD